MALFYENKPSSKKQNEVVTVKPSTDQSTAPEWFRNSEAGYAQKTANAPAVTGKSSGASGNSGRNVYIGKQPYGYDTARVKSAEEMSALMGGYNYNEAAIRSLFDKATKAEYAAKRAANQGAPRQFAANMGDYITTLSDTMRQQLNQAVATGGSRGLAAAQAMQAAQDASLKTVDEATKLTEDAMALDFEEAAAYTQNAKDAEALRATRQQNLMNFASGLYDIDERTTVGAMSAAADAWGSKMYGVDAAGLNLEGTKYNADANKATEELVARIQSDDNLKQLLLNGINSGAITPNDKLAALFGLAPGSLRNPPQNNYYGGGGYGGGYGNGGGSFTKDGFELNEETAREARRRRNQGVLTEDIALFKSGDASEGISATESEKRYTDEKNKLWHKANEKGMTYDKFKAWIAQTYGGTEEQALKFWNSYASKENKKTSTPTKPTTTKPTTTNASTNKPFMQQTIGETLQAGKQRLIDDLEESRHAYYRR